MVCNAAVAQQYIITSPNQKIKVALDSAGRKGGWFLKVDYSNGTKTINTISFRESWINIE